MRRRLKNSLKIFESFILPSLYLLSPDSPSLSLTHTARLLHVMFFSPFTKNKQLQDICQMRVWITLIPTDWSFQNFFMIQNVGDVPMAGWTVLAD